MKKGSGNFFKVHCMHLWNYHMKSLYIVNVHKFKNVITVLKGKTYSFWG
jgi:hypothetical protein